MKSSIQANSTHVGRIGEELAAQALTVMGYEIIDRNWRGPVGEIDLIARDAEFIVFVEVKTRRSTKFGAPEEAVGAGKQRRLADTALEYLMRKSQQDKSWRADLVAIELSSSNKVIRITHYVGIELL